MIIPTDTKKNRREHVPHGADESFDLDLVSGFATSEPAMRRKSHE